MLEAISLGNQHVDDLTPPGNELSDRLVRGIHRRQWLGRQRGREGGEHAGIDRIGLRQAAAGLGEGAHLARIDDGNRQLSVLQRPHHHHLVATRRFQHGKRRRIVPQSTD